MYIYIYLVCLFYIRKLCCVFPVLHVVPISPSPNVVPGAHPAPHCHSFAGEVMPRCQFFGTFSSGVHGIFTATRYFFLQKLTKSLHKHIETYRVIQLYSYRTYFIYLLLFLGVYIDSYM